jgi:hypothetical protein
MPKKNYTCKDYVVKNYEKDYTHNNYDGRDLQITRTL